MGRPRIPKDEQVKTFGVSLSPEAFERLGKFQRDWIKKHGFRLPRSKAIELLIMRQCDVEKLGDGGAE
jgi:hypothetical protein